MKQLLDKIIGTVAQLHCLEGFVFRKSDCCFILKNGKDKMTVQLNHFVDSNSHALVICPFYGVRFDILHRWFEKYNHKPLSTSRNFSSVQYYGKTLSEAENFKLSIYDDEYDVPTNLVFARDESDFQITIFALTKTIETCMERFFPNYNTLEKIYERRIDPILRGIKSLKDVPDNGVDWIFIELTLCKLIAPENYNKFKSLMMDHIEWLRSRNEPNLDFYYDRLDEILTDMENNVVL